MFKFRRARKYVVVAFIDKVNERTDFFASEFPLHITIAGPFTTKMKEYKLLNNLAKILNNQDALVIVADHEENFGYNKETPVTVFEVNNDLVALNYDVVELLEHHGVNFVDPEYMKEGYRAHVTILPHTRRLHKGDIININNISVIDMAPGGNTSKRKVIKNFLLP